MQNGGSLDGANLHFIFDTYRMRESNRVVLNAPDVAMCYLIFGIYSRRESLDRC